MDKRRFEFKVLVVEDDSFLIDTLESMLIDCGYNVFKAGDGEEALEVLHKEVIHFVVSDIQMPRKSGYESLSEIKSSKLNKIDVLMMTGFSDIPKEKLIDLGAIAILSKPEELVEIPDYVETSRAKHISV